MMKTLRNQSGQLTLDFLFSCVLILSIAVVLGAMTFALTLTEVIQYVTFASARTYFAADITPDLQVQAGTNKATTLLKSLPFLTGAQASGWVTVTPSAPRNYSDYRDSLGVDPFRSQFVGVSLVFDIPIIKPTLPIFGAAAQPTDDRTFRVSSFLMREPTSIECTTYMNQTLQVLIQLNPNFGQMTSSAGYTAPTYVAMQDNGC